MNDLPELGFPVDGGLPSASDESAEDIAGVAVSRHQKLVRILGAIRKRCRPDRDPCRGELLLNRLRGFSARVIVIESQDDSRYGFTLQKI